MKQIINYQVKSIIKGLLTIITSALPLLFSSCSKDNPKPVKTDVYIGGSINSNTNGHETPVYWKNGILTNLSDGPKVSSVSSIYVSGNDVYASGIQSNGKTTIATYWKNGTAYALIEDSLKSSTAHSIAVVDGIIHVAGYYYDDNKSKALYWRITSSGSWTDSLSTNSGNSGANALYVSGSTAYIAGWEENLAGKRVAKIWQVTSNQKTEGTDLSDGKFNAYSFALTIANNNTYVVGIEYNSADVAIGRIWKNGSVTNLGYDADYIIPQTVAVSGNDVYVGGYEYITKAIPVCWKNGSVTKLINGTKSGYVNSIAISGNDVYVVGY